MIQYKSDEKQYSLIQILTIAKLCNENFHLIDIPQQAEFDMIYISADPIFSIDF